MFAYLSRSASRLVRESVRRKEKVVKERTAQRRHNPTNRSGMLPVSALDSDLAALQEAPFH